MALRTGKMFLTPLEVVAIAVIFKPEAEEFPPEKLLLERETNFCWDQLCARHRAKPPLCVLQHYLIPRNELARVAGGFLALRWARGFRSPEQVSSMPEVTEHVSWPWNHSPAGLRSGCPSAFAWPS